ncbi:MAG: hypothetical protein PHT60_14860 [Acidiphilium sp.]|nr:hypothetical protein [Acidiphilium sp.]MDD4937042.1 hypothetical protein [Acidiphilium sp.]
MDRRQTDPPSENHRDRAGSMVDIARMSNAIKIPVHMTVGAFLDWVP